MDFCYFSACMGQFPADDPHVLVRQMSVVLFGHAPRPLAVRSAMQAPCLCNELQEGVDLGGER